MARAGWIVGPRTDVLWFVLPAVTGYLCIYGHVALGLSSFSIWWFWNVVANGPHLYATISRTYLDTRERRERRALLVGSLALVLVGPLTIWVCIQTDSRLPFAAFLVVQLLWAYLHVARQHYGFLALYQKRGGERVGAANHADYWMFHVVMFGPVLSWLLRYPTLRESVGLSLSLSAVEQTIVAATPTVVGVALVAWGLRELGRFRRDGRVNLPKLLLVVAYVPLHLLILLRPTAVGGYDILLFNAALTFPHNFQYLAIVWFYSKNRYHPDLDARRYGWASVASRTVVRFACCAAVYSVVFYYVRWYFEGEVVPFSLGRFRWSEVGVGSTFKVSDLVASVWAGLIFHHYYLDQRIWKISRDRDLNRDLLLETR